MKLSDTRIGGPGASPPPAASSIAKPLDGRSLTLARIIWVSVAVLTVIFIAVSIPVEFARLQAVCTTGACQPATLTPANVRELGTMGLSAGFFIGYLLAVELVFAAISFAVGALIFWRKSDDRMALFVALALVTFGALAFVDKLDSVAAGYPALWWPFTLVTFLGNIFPVLFFYVFPDGRFVPRWTLALAISLVVLGVCFHFFPGSPLSRWLTSPPGLVLSVCFIGSAVFAQLYRYWRVSTPAQRQQTKWVVFGATTAMVVTQGVNIAFPLQDRTHVILTLISYTLLYLSLLLIPLSIGVAILRYHLFDINVIINRTLVYGALTASVVLLYVLVVGGLGAVLQVQGSLIVSLIATGLAAVMFQPLRDRLQRAVNRMMYGERHEPYAVLSRLGKRLETSLAPNAVLPTVVETVAQALKLPYVAVEVGKDDTLEMVAATGEPARNPLRMPLVYGGETVEILLLGPRSEEEDFSPADRRLLEDLAHQIGVAAHAARLTEEAVRLSADLQRSRERLVNTREEERRRLRRDLHDGLGPQLASLTMKAEAARDLIAVDTVRAETLLSSLIDQTQSAVADVRRLVYALRPPALDALGSRRGDPVASFPPRPRRHAREGRGSREAASSARRRRGRRLPDLPRSREQRRPAFRGEGLRRAPRPGNRGWSAAPANPGRRAGIGEDRSSGIGLASMRERAGELGGWCTVQAVPSGGTIVKASLPALDVKEEAAKPDLRGA